LHPFFLLPGLLEVTESLSYEQAAEKVILNGNCHAEPGPELDSGSSISASPKSGTYETLNQVQGDKKGVFQMPVKSLNN